MCVLFCGEPCCVSSCVICVLMVILVVEGSPDHCMDCYNVCVGIFCNDINFRGSYSGPFCDGLNN